MFITWRKLALPVSLFFLFTGASWAQMSTLEGKVKGEDGQPLVGVQIRIERKDVKGIYRVKTDKKGRFVHAGLPLGGHYKVILELNGKDRDAVDNVRTRLDIGTVDFDLQAQKKKSDELNKAVQSGTLTEQQSRQLSPEQKADIERNVKLREAALSKNKALNDAYNQGM